MQFSIFHLGRKNKQMNCSIEDLYKSFRTALKSFIAARTRDDKLAEDLVQDTFVKLADYCNRGCECRHPKSFLFKTAPAEANLGLGCGNPTAIAGMKPGETVLDLGSGAGFDCFLAANQVGPQGHVIGIDMTPEMIEKARTIALRRGTRNVEFRLGEIEHLPMADNSVDVIISNCVVNLAPDKPKVFREAYRVLKSGGRLAVSDTALLKELPENIKNSLDAHVACIAGAIPIDAYKPILEQAGFRNIRITVKTASNCVSSDTTDPIGRSVIKEYGDEIQLNEFITSIYIEGTKE